VCSLPWPCETRRRQLIAEYDRAKVSLSLLMSAYFVDAANDLPDVPAGELYGRFVLWIRDR
jgi:hypothetical protein